MCKSDLLCKAIWLDEAALSGWLHGERSGQRGASLTYSEAAITAVLVLKAVYRLPLRGAQGFVGSVLGLMGLALPTPHYSTLSRRQAGLELEVPRLTRDQPMHLVVDSTGCKVYGEGEWKVRVHGKSKRPGALWADGASCIWAWMSKAVRLWRRC